MVFVRLKDIAMAFQQMSQEDDNSGYIPLALYLCKFFISYSFTKFHNKSVT
jgi:hypothetical protein